MSVNVASQITPTASRNRFTNWILWYSNGHPSNATTLNVTTPTTFAVMAGNAWKAMASSNGCNSTCFFFTKQTCPETTAKMWYVAACCWKKKEKKKKTEK